MTTTMLGQQTRFSCILPYLSDVRNLVVCRCHGVSVRFSIWSHTNISCIWCSISRSLVKLLVWCVFHYFVHSCFFVTVVWNWIAFGCVNFGIPFLCVSALTVIKLYRCHKNNVSWQLGLSFLAITAPAEYLMIIYKCSWLANTPCSEKSGTLDFGHNFCKCRPIFKISPLTTPQEILYATMIEASTSPELHCYTTLSYLKIKNNSFKNDPFIFCHFFLKYSSVAIKISASML